MCLSSSICPKCIQKLFDRVNSTIDEEVSKLDLGELFSMEKREITRKSTHETSYRFYKKMVKDRAISYITISAPLNDNDMDDVSITLLKRANKKLHQEEVSLKTITTRTERLELLCEDFVEQLGFDYKS